MTWRISSYLCTYLRFTSPVRLKMNNTQVILIQLQAFELELDFAENIKYTDVRIADLCWAPYVIYRVTSYLQLLALSILTCRPNMSFLGRLVSDNSSSFEKIELGYQPPVRKNFCTGSEFLFVAICALYLTFLASNFHRYKLFSQIADPEPY